jgi:hypothetical protein
MAFAIKTEVSDPRAKTFALTAQKTMYGGKHIAEGDTVFVFASENEGGQGLIARGVVTSAEAVAKKPGPPGKHRVSASPSDAPRSRSARWGGVISNISPPGMTAYPRPSSILNSIVRPRTRSSASRMKRRHSSTNSSSANRVFHMETPLK